MLLFSTTLDMQDHVTPDDFIKLVLEWNEGSKYADNRVTGIDWHGERNVRYGDAGLWMEFVEYPEQGILAVRHEKITKDGVAWDSDFIMNTVEKRIAIQLDRTYSEDALVIDAAFSTPHFITLLIEHGFIKDDVDLPVLRTPIYVIDDDLNHCQRAFAEDSPYKLGSVSVQNVRECRPAERGMARFASERGGSCFGRAKYRTVHRHPQTGRKSRDAVRSGAHFLPFWIGQEKELFLPKRNRG